MNFSINHYGWGQTGPFPEVSGSINTDGQQLIIKFDVREPEIRAVYSFHNEMVCNDSCVEFFFSPYPFDKRYINIEVNPIGTVLAYIGEGRHNRIPLSEEQIYSFGAKTTIDRSNALAHWTLQYVVPYSLIAEVYGQEPISEMNVIRCNFYKCGDSLKNPHWGSWMPIETENPDFHRPEYFVEVALN